jgi:hypothetical protein
LVTRSLRQTKSPDCAKQKKQGQELVDGVRHLVANDQGSPTAAVNGHWQPIQCPKNPAHRN